jgi:hypothetical protein
VSVIAISVSLALLGSVVAVALVVRDVAFRAIAGQIAAAEASSKRALAADVDKLAGRVANVEATVRDVSLSRMGR